MTIGSPLALAPGPRVLATTARRVPSGDHESAAPAPGFTEFVPCVVASRRASDPSAFATATPLLSPTLPKNAIHFPSGDQRGLDAPLPSRPSRVAVPLATSRIQISEYGCPGRSLRVTA